MCVDMEVFRSNAVYDKAIKSFNYLLYIYLYDRIADSTVFLSGQK